VTYKYFGDKIFVVHYNRNEIIISSKQHYKLKCSYVIEWDYFGQGIDLIRCYDKYKCLEENLVPINSIKLPTQETQSELPELIDYVRQYSSEMKTIFYPGAGFDLSPLQLFGTYGDPAQVYLVDYFIYHSETPIRQRIYNVGENITELYPSHFNRNNWSEFWSDDENFFNENFHHPNHAWGIQAIINNQQDESKKFNFIYLGTEGIKTASILLDNHIYPDVLVLEDHGIPRFSGAQSLLYKEMSKHLPLYILMDPLGAGGTEIWPGYEQVTEGYLPEIYHSLSQSQNPRALFKRIK